MCVLNELIESICELLIGSRNTDHNIIRVHTRKLQKFGDLSFPLSSKNWFKFVDKSHIKNSSNIFAYKVTKNELLEQSLDWTLSIESILIKDDDNVVVYLNQKKAFKAGIKHALTQARNFGSNCVEMAKDVYVPHNTVNLAKINLTELKLHILQSVTRNILAFNNYNVTESDSNNVLKLSFTSTNGQKQAITCGSVLNELGTKDTTTTAEQFYSKRSVDMRLMAEHKYGVRVTTFPGWKEFFEKLGEAAVIIHLLQNKPQHTTIVKLNDPTCCSVKGASFILYNCARLATLLKEFDKKVNDCIYPALPDLNDMEFDLLVEPEEWELLFIYILRFPIIVKSCISQIEKYQISPHFLVLHLNKLSSTFSVYYRRVRILTEPREHLFPVLHQRIYLLKALQYVIHNGLGLLNIQPVKQM